MQIRLGCGMAGLRSLPEGSVDLVLTDPPSGHTVAKFDVVPDLCEMWGSIWWALRPRGVAVIMASSLKFASQLLSYETDRFRHDLVWEKTAATGHLNVKRAPLRAHENILVFSLTSQYGYYPQMSGGHTPIHPCTRIHGSENYDRMRRNPPSGSRAGATDRYSRSVLHFGSVGTSSKKRIHPQQKPVELLEYLVRSYSSPGDLVADPFAGSGSTGKAAIAQGRRFLGWDTSERFANEGEKS